MLCFSPTFTFKHSWKSKFVFGLLSFLLLEHHCLAISVVPLESLFETHLWVQQQNCGGGLCPWITCQVFSVKQLIVLLIFLGTFGTPDADNQVSDCLHPWETNGNPISPQSGTKFSAPKWQRLSPHNEVYPRPPNPWGGGYRCCGCVWSLATETSVN